MDVLSLPMYQGTVNGYLKWTGISDPDVHVNLKATTAKQLTRQLSGESRCLPVLLGIVHL